MPIRLDSLEKTLEKIAYDFATSVLTAAVRSRITDLSVVLRDPRAVDVTGFAAEVDAALQRFAVARVSQSHAHSKAAKADERAARQARSPSGGPGARSRKAAVGLGTGRSNPASSRSRQLTSPDRGFDDDDDSGENIITDPSLLLEVIGSGTAPEPRGSRASRSNGSGLLGHTEPRQSDSREPRSNGKGPALRPGESLQRTSGGTLVLRRGGR